MAVTMTETAVERSTFAVTVTFKDEDGVLVVPTAATWTLLTPDGDVVNSRLDVAFSPLGSSGTAVLTDADLNISDGAGKRRLLIEATYDSSLGTGLSLREEAEFFITDLIGV